MSANPALQAAQANLDGAGYTGAGVQAQLRSPKRGGLLTLLGTGCAAGVDHATLRVVLADRLPDLQQISGMGCQDAHGKCGATSKVRDVMRAL